MLPGIPAYNFRGLHIKISNWALRLDNVKMRIKIVAYFLFSQAFQGQGRLSIGGYGSTLIFGTRTCVSV